MKKINPNSNRIFFIDELRGFLVIAMICYHFMYNLVCFFGVHISLFYSPFLNFFISCVSAMFIFIAGCMCNYSKNNLKRGLICLGIAFSATIITYFCFYVPYVFGVLHLIGFCILGFHYALSLIKKINPLIGMSVALLLTHLTYNVKDGYMNLLWFKFNLPYSLYQSKFMFVIGFPRWDFQSLDYFPFFPWLWCFLAGSYFGVLLKEGKLPKFFYSSKLHSKLLATIGLNSLFIYVVHQPIMYLTMLAIFYIIN